MVDDGRTFSLVLAVDERAVLARLLSNVVALLVESRLLVQRVDARHSGDGRAKGERLPCYVRVQRHLRVHLVEDGDDERGVRRGARDEQARGRTSETEETGGERIERR